MEGKLCEGENEEGGKKEGWVGRRRGRRGRGKEKKKEKKFSSSVGQV